MNVFKVLVLLVLSFSIQSNIRAQQPILEVEGKAKITEMDEVSSSDKVVVKLPDGTLAELPIANLNGECNAFGDGSAGDVAISSTIDWAASPPTGGNYMFKNLTISSGLILFVPSGTVISIQDTFINNGIIVVDAGILGAEDSFSGNGRSSVAGYSGFQRYGINKKESLRSQFQPGPIAGSNGGSGAGEVTGKVSGGGGGTLIIKAGKNLVNNGTIAALGRNGADLSSNMTNVGGPGGGGGGFVILMSNGNIENTDTILASGGNGGEPGTSGFAGGGGGGGLIHLISPNADAIIDGLNVQGGSKGTASTMGSSGGHGGGSIGDGGSGGFDFPTTSLPENGQPGAVLRTQVTNVCALVGN